jgi:hemolysin activation/secretion protein
VLWLRGQWDAIDLTSRRPAWRADAVIELRKGLDIFNATDGCGGPCAPDQVPTTRIDGEANAMLLRAAFTGEVALGDSFSVMVSPRAQYAFDPLMSFEEFTAGNYTIGRGYDPSVLMGDSGLGFIAELRGPRFMPIARSQLSLQPYVFGDAAWVWNKNDGVGSDHLTSAGGGIRAELSDRLRFDTALAVPLEKTGIANRKGDVRLLVTLTGRFLP